MRVIKELTPYHELIAVNNFMFSIHHYITVL